MTPNKTNRNKSPNRRVSTEDNDLNYLLPKIMHKEGNRVRVTYSKKAVNKVKELLFDIIFDGYMYINNRLNKSHLSYT